MTDVYGNYSTSWFFVLYFKSFRVCHPFVNVATFLTMSVRVIRDPLVTVPQGFQYPLTHYYRVMVTIPRNIAYFPKLQIFQRAVNTL
jgi:hypothetical protein